MIEDFVPFAGSCEPAPSAEFIGAAQAFALAAGLDVQRVVQGDPMQLHGLDFWLQHDGDRDPTGLVLMVAIGALPEGDEESACRQLLETHFLGSCESDGVYCLLPDTRLVARRLRLDLATSAESVQAIFRFVERMAALKREAVPSLPPAKGDSFE